MRWLLLFMFALLSFTCTPSLQEAHIAGLVARRGAPPGTVGMVPSGECAGLDRAHRRWGDWATFFGVLGGTAGVATIPTYGYMPAVVAEGVTAGASAVAWKYTDEMSDRRAAEWAEKGCGAP